MCRGEAEQRENTSQTAALGGSMLSWIGRRRGLIRIFLLIAFIASSAFVISSGTDQEQVDQIWLSSTLQQSKSGSLHQVVYFVTCIDSARTQSVFSPLATLQYSKPRMKTDAAFQGGSCSRLTAEGNDANSTVCSAAVSGGEWKYQLWSKMGTSLRDSAEYFVFIDFNQDGRWNLSSDGLLDFQEFLVNRNPTVAVPHNECNTHDISSDLADAISSIYDTSFVAIHRRARKLLIPIQESLLSLICHLMIRGSTLQFRINNQRNTLVSDCGIHDIANQNEMIDFLTSLQSKRYLDALPFSPRMHAARPPAPVEFTVHATVMDSDESCVVRCEFVYWRHHPAFECCEDNIDVSPADYNSYLMYMHMWQKYDLPHPSTLLGRGQHLTHPLPRFILVLSGAQSGLSDACFHEDFTRTSEALESFRLTVIPEKMDLRTGSNLNALDVQVQLTLSAPASQEQCAVFARVNEMTVKIMCDSNEYVSVVEGPFLETQSMYMDRLMKNAASAPSFYSPGPSWFHLTSSMLTDTLRTRSFNVSVNTQCDDMFEVSVRAKVALRGMCQNSKSMSPCLGTVLDSLSPVIIHSARAETRRSSFLTDAPASDLFDIEQGKPIKRGSRDIFSDFSCAGPNRHWPHADASGHYGPGVKLSTGVFNMCLIQNACWINKQIILYMPERINVLSEFGFFDFPNMILSKDPTLGKFFAPTIIFGRIPLETTFAANIVHYAMQREGRAVKREYRNFGHAVWEELGSIFHALQTFDLPREDGRIVLLTDHGQSKTFPPLFSRVSAYIDEFPNGTCFRRMVMGFAGVGSFEQGFSLYRSAHSVEFRKFYLNMLNVTHLTTKPRRGAPIIVNMYPKVVVGNGHVWSDVCKLANELSDMFSKLQFRCISLHEMSLEVQAQVISQATIHVWPNGMCMICSLFTL